MVMMKLTRRGGMLRRGMLLWVDTDQESGSTAQLRIAAIGSVTRIYGSVSSLEARNLRNDQYKDLLLDPKNASESECNRLKLHACSLGRGIWYTREEGGGVFLKGGAARFMITDDLQVIPGSTAACISLFRKLGIKDGNEVEERTVEIGAKEHMGNINMYRLRTLDLHFYFSRELKLLQGDF
ncbi:hypothetical protein LOK49_LG14G00156 [Camellia lanceoleosa]|uniref:Uncharacterized protein n=1 Tax=Camellia lanceoleosa TaxID=1840588 RepID=A0ACC0FF25_9ERIC|nr:hypothetical protein LOK49_LG14G00156 [Camellia lanceoleosa]